jgi:hypothetical protein
MPEMQSQATAEGGGLLQAAGRCIFPGVFGTWPIQCRPRSNPRDQFNVATLPGQFQVGTGDIQGLQTARRENAPVYPRFVLDSWWRRRKAPSLYRDVANCQHEVRPTEPAEIIGD